MGGRGVELLIIRMNEIPAHKVLFSLLCKVVTELFLNRVTIGSGWFRGEGKIVIMIGRSQYYQNTDFKFFQCSPKTTATAVAKRVTRTNYTAIITNALRQTCSLYSWT